MPALWTRAGLSWRHLVGRIVLQAWEDDVPGRCAELAFFFLFSIFPLLFFLTTLLGYVTAANLEFRGDLFEYIARVSPSSEVTELIHDTLAEVTAARTGTKLGVSLAVTLWVASSGMLAVGRSLNTAYGVEESRNIVWARVNAILLTLTFTVLIVAALLLIFYGGSRGEALAERVGLDWIFGLAWPAVRWLLILAFVVFSFEAVYNYAPNLSGTHRRHWITPGGLIGVALWLLASFGLRLYLDYFTTYTTAYGSLGAVILLLLWFYLTGFALLMGGEVNSEIEREISRYRGRPVHGRRRRTLGR